MKEEEVQVFGLDLGSVSWKLIQFRWDNRIRDAFYCSRFISTFLGWWETRLFDRAKNYPRIYSYICRSTSLLASLERELFVGECSFYVSYPRNKEWSRRIDRMWHRNNLSHVYKTKSRQNLWSSMIWDSFPRDAGDCYLSLKSLDLCNAPLITSHSWTKSSKPRSVKISSLIPTHQEVRGRV